MSDTERMMRELMEATGGTVDQPLKGIREIKEVQQAAGPICKGHRLKIDEIDQQARTNRTPDQNEDV
jgi:hypothetical protein